MLLTLEEAMSIDNTMTKADLFAYESAIRDYTNNHFHRENYHPIISRIEGAKVYFDGLNLFKVDDTAELVGTTYFDGFYLVRSVGVDYIELDTDEPIQLMDSDNNPRLFQSLLPSTMKTGLLKLLKYQSKVESKQGIKSETIARMSITYESGQDYDNTVNGLPSHLFDFCEPYIKMRW